MGLFGVVEGYLVVDYVLGLEFVVDFLEIDGFLFQGLLEFFDEDVVYVVVVFIY